jgi:uncharacterized protein YjbJ (UPF0337 family)
MRGTKAKAAGTTTSFKGKLIHAWGELTDNNQMKVKGRRTKAKGKREQAKGRFQNAIDALKG